VSCLDDDLRAITEFTTMSGPGRGLAVCPSLDLLATSDTSDRTVSVYEFPVSKGRGAAPKSGGLRLLYMFKVTEGPEFCAYGTLGCLAFTPPGDETRAARPLLLVIDSRQQAVHVVDVIDRVHVGYVAAPGTVDGPQGVAVSLDGSLVAVSTCPTGTFQGSGAIGVKDDAILLYRNCGGTAAAAWEKVRVIRGGLNQPLGLRFTRDGTAICVANLRYSCASLFRVADGVLVRHVAFVPRRGLRDLEEVEGGWLLACPSIDSAGYVGFGSNTDPECREAVPWWPRCCLTEPPANPTSLAVVPGYGVVVREFGQFGRLQVFTTPDAMAMAAMSRLRVAWMFAVVSRGRHPAPKTAAAVDVKL
jgi:hypothetical protein